MTNPLREGGVRSGSLYLSKATATARAMLQTTIYTTLCTAALTSNETPLTMHQKMSIQFYLQPKPFQFILANINDEQNMMSSKAFALKKASRMF